MHVWQQKKSVNIVCSWANSSTTPIKEPNETVNTTAVAKHNPVLFKFAWAIGSTFTLSDTLVQLWHSTGNVLFAGRIIYDRNGDRWPVFKSRLHERAKIQMRQFVFLKSRLHLTPARTQWKWWFLNELQLLAGRPWVHELMTATQNYFKNEVGFYWYGIVWWLFLSVSSAVCGTRN